MNTQDKISWIFNYLRQKTKQNILMIKNTKTNVYFKIGNNSQILDIYKPTIDKINTINGLISESKFQFGELV